MKRNYLISFITFVVACGGSPSGQVYVVNNVGNSVLRFANMGTADGNVAPSAELSGANTTFNSPQYLAYDSSHDDLYVTNSGTNQILVYHAPSQKNGNTAPSRKIGSSTLTSLAGIAYSSGSNRLYGVNSTNGKILIFNNSSALNGTTLTPNVSFTSNTAFSSPTGILVVRDNNDDNLIICDTGHNQIQGFVGASTIADNTTPVPDFTLSGFGLPVSVALDSTDLLTARLIVSNNGGNSITVYSHATSFVTGTPTPVYSLTTSVSAPEQIFMDIANNTLWVANSGDTSIFIYGGFPSINSNSSPTRTIKGASTGLSGPTGVVADPNH